MARGDPPFPGVGKESARFSSHWKKPQAAATRTEVSLKELETFLVNPSKHFCTEVLGLRLPENGSELQDVEPFTLDTLAQYEIVTRLVARYLAGADRCDEELEIIRAEGMLPHAGFARAHAAVLDGKARELARVVASFTGAPPCRLDARTIDLAQADWRLTGLLEGLSPRCLVRYRPATIKPKDRLAIWVQHLVLAAMRATHRAAQPPPGRRAIRNQRLCCHQPRDDVPIICHMQIVASCS